MEDSTMFKLPVRKIGTTAEKTTHGDHRHARNRI